MNQKIVDYLRDYLDKGYSPEQLSVHLKNHGFSQEQIDDCMAIALNIPHNPLPSSPHKYTFHIPGSSLMKPVLFSGAALVVLIVIVLPFLTLQSPTGLVVDDTCSIYDGPSLDRCNAQLAMKYEDEEFCKNISDKMLKDTCYFEVARATNNPQLCRNIIGYGGSATPGRCMTEAS